MKKIFVIFFILTGIFAGFHCGTLEPATYIPRHRVMAKYDPVMESAGLRYEYQMKFKFRPSAEFLYGNISYFLVRGNWYLWKWFSLNAGIGLFHGNARGYDAEFYPSLAVGVKISLPIFRFMFEIEAGTWGQFYPTAGLSFGVEF